jgi:large subunit ribosomal protein L29
MIKELRQKSIDELKNIVSEKREKLRQLRFDLAAGKVKNVREIRKIRRDIARILTVLKEKSSENNNLIKRVKK